MFMKIDKTLILNKIKEHYSFKKDAEFARFLEIKTQTLSSWYTRNTFDIELLYAKCVGIDGNFLLTGVGNIFLDDAKRSAVGDDTVRLKEENLSLKETNDLLRFKVGVLEERLSEIVYTRPNSIISQSLDEPEHELTKIKTENEKK